MSDSLILMAEGTALGKFSFTYFGSSSFANLGEIKSSSSGFSIVGANYYKNLFWLLIGLNFGAKVLCE